MGAKKASRKSASKWDQSSERALMEVWSEKMNELRGCRKNSHILSEMVASLQAQGYKYTIVELKTKMHNVTARYRREKRNSWASGSPSEWDLFKEVELLLSPYTSCKSECQVVDSINNINSSIMYHPLLPTVTSPMTSSTMTASSPLPSPSIPASSPSSLVDSPSPTIPAYNSSPAASSTAATTKQDGLANFFRSLEKNIEQINEDVKNTTERMIAIEEEKKEMLRKYVDRESEVQMALIEFLKRF